MSYPRPGRGRVLAWGLILVVAGIAAAGGCAQAQQAGVPTLRPGPSAAATQTFNVLAIGDASVLASGPGGLPWGWGSNEHGELGMGTTSQVASILATNASQPVLYIEFRKDGSPIDSGPWWAAKEGEKVRG